MRDHTSFKPVGHDPNLGSISTKVEILDNRRDEFQDSRETTGANTSRAVHYEGKVNLGATSCGLGGNSNPFLKSFSQISYNGSSYLPMLVV